MPQSLPPYAPTIPDNHEVVFDINCYISTDDQGGNTKHVYSTPLVYPMDPAFLATGGERVRAYIQQEHLPSTILLTHESTQVVRKNGTVMRVIGNNCLSLIFSGKIFAHLDEMLVAKILAVFYDQESVSVRITTIFDR